MGSPKIRVLHVIKGLDRGGAERLLLSTIRNHREGFGFEVVYFLSGKAMLDGELIAAGARVTCLPVRKMWDWFLVIFRLVRFIRRRGGIDIIHAHLPVPGVVARFAGLITGLPVVYTEHNLVNRYRYLSRWCSRLTYRLQDRTIAVSQAVADAIRLTYRPIRPIAVIPNGVDVREFDPARFDRLALRQRFGIPNANLVIGVVAVMTEQKRLDRWLKVAGQLSEVSEAIFFVVVGDGPLRAGLEWQAKDLLKAGRICFTGVVANPAEWLACMDIFMLTSDFEGLPVALLEAMSIGCVPVCTPAGGIPSLVRTDENGFLVSDEFTGDSIAVIRKLQMDSSELIRIGAAARQTVVDEYSITRMTGQLEEMYRDLLKKSAVTAVGYV